MLKAFLVSVAAAGLVGCKAETQGSSLPLATCGWSDTTRASGNGIGQLRIGTPMRLVRARCKVVFDSLLENGAEGLPEHRVAVRIGIDTVWATADSGKVWRIEVRSRRIRTKDLLGVDTKATTLRARGANLLIGEDAAYAVIPTVCGLSFGLSSYESAWAAIPDDTRVTRMLIVGCKSR